MAPVRKTYTTEFKIKVVKEILREEKSLSQIASEYGTHVNVISRWRDQVLAGFPALFDDRVAQDQAAKEAEWEREREGLYAEMLADNLPLVLTHVGLLEQAHLRTVPAADYDTAEVL
ncbi:transposase [Ktedonobacter sp. SOSP1-85]|uniref:transposase n=1 Tax=Ktedonobacter sp. SOSP1-85 TaxID=2778367 RepID=UPI0019155E04|nr:transposase [Ktedonobacter sp. SOSP1-85]